ncbi:MAG: hypothetical protein JWL73_268 [Actinomycetia bacterium]|nr:hypothetical protein [Actinomycetes bacterium]
MTPGRRVSSVAVFVAAALLAVSAGIWLLDRNGSATTASSTLRSVSITDEGGDTVRSHVDPVTQTITVRGGPLNTGDQARTSFWVAPQSALSDQEVCVTFTSDSGDHDQEGITLRNAVVGDRYHAVLFTKNVFPIVNGTFNLYVLDQDLTTTVEVPQMLKSFDLSSTIAPGGTVAAFPWRVCAEVSGRTFRFKVWSPTKAEPEYGDPAHSGSFTLPVASWAGTGGVYAGHVDGSERVVFDDLQVGAGQ